MGRPDALSAPQRSISAQAARRLVFGLALLVAVVALSSALFYRAAVDKAAVERANDLRDFYQTRLAQLERDWELQARDLRVRIEYTRILEQPATALLRLQAFMTLQNTERRFHFVVIQDRAGNHLFSFGREQEFADRVAQLPPQTPYLSDAVTGQLYRVLEEPLWLGGRGQGRMRVLFACDNALLGQLAAPGITLRAAYLGIPVASSLGTADLQTPAADEGATRRTLSWRGAAADPLQLVIHAPVKTLFTSAELALAAAAIPLFDGLILWFVLGTWLLRQTRRINALGAAVRDASAADGDLQRMESNLAAAGIGFNDEIDAVAATIRRTTAQALERERERREEEEQRRLWSMVFANSNEAIVITDRRNRIVAVNRAFTTLTGYPEAEVKGGDPKMLSARRESPEFYAAMWREINDKGRWQGEVHDRRKDGSVYPKWLSIVAVTDASGAICNYIGIFSDITDRKAAEQRIVYLATHDSLTGLPNRSLLSDRLARALALAGREQRMVAVLFLDLDRFKWINDSFGHQSGDELLKAVGARLRGAVRTSDTVARLGGDEFVIMVQMNAAQAADLGQIAGKVIEAVARPFELEGREFHVTTSVGVSAYPMDGGDADTLLKHADTAMYAAKAAGRNQVRFFDPGMNRAAMERAELEGGLRQALAAGQFELFYQPKFCLGNDSPCGAEALIRWRHPERGLVPPDTFIPLAEETGLVVALGEWVLRNACAEIRRRLDAGIAPAAAAVNISAAQLESPAFVDLLAEVLTQSAVPPSLLELELTETAVLHNPQQSIETLHRARELGVKLSLDDFGTGYSSLAYLRQLPVHTIKIDRSFVEGLPDNAEATQIASMIIALAKSIGRAVVAEGVETRAQLDHLRALGCDMAQGYYIARPMPVSEYHAWLAARPCSGCAQDGACPKVVMPPVGSLPAIVPMLPAAGTK